MTKVGRPKKEELEKRSTSLPAVRCTEAEKIDLLSKAGAANESLSDWIRQQLMSAPLKRTTTNRIDAGIITELVNLRRSQDRIGNNLNQIARALNRGRDEDPHHIAYVLNEIHQNSLLIDETIERVARRYGS